MITVTKFNGRQITINALLIETIEETPDTIITLTTGNKHVVKEPVETVKAYIVQFLSSISWGKIPTAIQTKEGMR